MIHSVRIKKASRVLALFAVFFSFALQLWAEGTIAPTISYSGPNSYTINSAITDLAPTTGGGASTSGGDFGTTYTLAGGGSAGGILSGNLDGTGTAAKFNYVGNFVVDPDGIFGYLIDTSNNKIRKIEISTGVVTTFAGGGSVGGRASGHADGTGTSATFNGLNSQATLNLRA